MAENTAWLRAFLRESCFRSGLVLYGNTRDLFWSGAGPEYLTLPTLLLRSVNADKPNRFTIRASWDRADGLVFAEDRDQQGWDSAVASQLNTGSRTGNAYDFGGNNDADAEQEQDQTVGRHVELNELLAEYRLVLAEPGERPLLVLDWSHLLVTQAAHPDQGEREWILQLGKALVGEPVRRLDSDSLRDSSGTLVLLSANLGSVPPNLYQGEARIRLLSVPAPTRTERKEFFRRHSDDLRIEKPRSADSRVLASTPESIADTLADLTDQLATVDLRQVLTLSQLSGSALPPDRLLNLYRFGEQESPWEELSDERIEGVEDVLGERVIGQDHAVGHVATMIMRASLGMAGLQHSGRRSKPKGTLFFVGPTGVGKTELAKATAEFLFGDEGACIRFDMSEYNHEHSDQRLVGAPPGYVGFEEGGQLTNAVSERPFSVLLFDEIEKAHKRVLDKFLQILEDGRLTDGRGETAWFSESVIIFTSNIGAADAPKTDAGPTAYHLHFMAAVEQHFNDKLERPELLNRLGDNIVVFQPIVDKTLRQSILTRKLQPLRTHLQERWGVELDLGSGVELFLVEQARADHGGRGLLNAVERLLMNPLARFLFARRHQLRKGRKIVVSMEGEATQFELEGS